MPPAPSNGGSGKLDHEVFATGTPPDNVASTSGTPDRVVSTNGTPDRVVSTNGTPLDHVVPGTLENKSMGFKKNLIRNIRKCTNSNSPKYT